MIYIFFLFLNIPNKYSSMTDDTYNARKVYWIKRNKKEAEAKEAQKNNEVQRMNKKVQMRKEAEQKKAWMIRILYEQRMVELLCTINSRGVQEGTMIRLRKMLPSQLEDIIENSPIGVNVNIAIEAMLESIATEEANKKAMIARMVGLGQDLDYICMQQ